MKKRKEKKQLARNLISKAGRNPDYGVAIAFLMRAGVLMKEAWVSRNSRLYLYWVNTFNQVIEREAPESFPDQNRSF